MDVNGDSRSKRKQPPTSISDRPMKQLKESSEYTNGSSEYQNGREIELDGEEARALTRVPTTADTAEWQATVEKVIKNVVSIHFCQTCSFDTDPAIASEATGFVVDAEKGYILTNRVSDSIDDADANFTFIS
jgi:S1-C subfamily serine protease